MNATEKKYVEKLKKYIEEILKYKFVIPMDMYDKFESEISALEQQIKEPEDELREELLKFLEWFRIEVCTEDIPIEDEYFVDKFLSIISKMP